MQNGEFIRLAYSGKIKETGQPFDSAESAPVIVGAGYVIAGVDEVLQGMSIGEKKTVDVQPEKAFGPRDPDMVKLVPEAEFKRHGTRPKPGMVINADNMRGRILSVASGRVTIDFNHPLAGKVLVFDLEVKSRAEKPDEKVAAIAEFYSRLAPDKISVKMADKEAEITVPPVIPPVFKKKIADDAIKWLDLDRVKFAEVFEKPKEQL